MKKLLDIIAAIFDMLPSRKEALLNAINDTKAKIKYLQDKPGTWTAIDSAHYYKLTDELSKLEKRAQNAGA